jgi:predicted dehydrogenase
MINRREFLKTSAAAGVALYAPAVFGAEKDKKYATALVGSGWWGMNILRCALQSGECKCVAICDVDQSQLDKAMAEVEKISGEKPKRYEDYRELLAKEKPEIVINATPDHWHPLITIDAVKGGAHVYVEKPICHTIREGRAMVSAARAAGRVVQVGTHRRVSPHNVAGRDFVRSGKLGKVGMVRAFVHYGGGPETASPNGEVPQGLNWDMWCGPAPLRPYNPRMHPKGFRNFLDYGNGTLGDWGIHWMDQILWVMEAKYPQMVFSTGGRPVKGPVVNTAAAQTTDAPDHQIAVFKFDEFDVSWEHRTFGANNAEKTHPQQPVGAYFYGTEGTLHIGWMDGTTFYPADAKKAAVNIPPQLNLPDGQNIKELFADFLAAIKGGTRPISDIEAGYYSTNLALLGMLSLKLGRSLRWDGEKEIVVGDEQANAMLSRKYRGEWKYPEA